MAQIIPLDSNGQINPYREFLIAACNIDIVQEEIEQTPGSVNISDLESRLRKIGEQLPQYTDTDTQNAYTYIKNKLNYCHGKLGRLASTQPQGTTVPHQQFTNSIPPTPTQNPQLSTTHTYSSSYTNPSYIPGPNIPLSNPTNLSAPRLSIPGS